MLDSYTQPRSSETSEVVSTSAVSFSNEAFEDYCDRVTKLEKIEAGSWDQINAHEKLKLTRERKFSSPWNGSVVRSGNFATRFDFLDGFRAGLKSQLTEHCVGIRDTDWKDDREGFLQEVRPKLSKHIFRRLCGARLEKSDEDIRNHSLTRLKDYVISDPKASKLGLSLLTKAGKVESEESLGRSITDAFAGKATSTLQKRSSALYRMWTHMIIGGEISALRLSERNFYEYLCNLRDTGGSSSSAQGAIEALRFIDGIVHFTKMKVCEVISARCKGLARGLRLTKRPLVQKVHIPCLVLMELERLMCDLGNHHRCILGQCLYCLHSCCRWRDGRRLLSSGGVQLLEGRALKSKTSLQQDLAVRFIPYLGIGTGLSGTNWGLLWLTARDAEFGETEKEHFLPSYSERKGCWGSSPMSSSEAMGYLREFIHVTKLVADDELASYGTHSLKCTLLTYVGRCTAISFSASERRLLGHHIKPGDKSMLTYSREAHTTVSGKLIALFNLIRTGSFNPDEAVGRRMLDVAEECLEPKAVDVGMENSGRSESSSDSSSFEDMGDEEIATPKFRLTRSPFPDTLVDDCYVHRISGICHLRRPLSDLTYCGQKLSSSYKELGSFHSEGDPECCINCGKALKAAS